VTPGDGLPMKILHLHWRNDSYGGGERYLHGICRIQKEMGFTVVTVSDRRFGAAPAFDSGKDRQYFIEPSMGIRSGRREIGHVLEIVGTESPDLVHLHHTGCLISPMILQEIIVRFPTVKTVHDASLLCPHTGKDLLKVCNGKICEFPSGIGCIARGCHPMSPKGLADWMRNTWEKRASRRIDRFIVSSRFMKCEYIRNHFPEEKIEILPLYVERQDPGPPVPCGTGSHEKTLLFVGRLDGTKGVFHFIEALRLLRSEQWEAGIVGEGPAREEIGKRIRDTGLGGRIALHGKVPAERMSEFYRMAYLVSMPSLIPESFGLVGIEAMSFGKPVIAYDSGGIRDWLVDGENGFLVERGNIGALSQRISFLLNNDRVAATMGRKGEERVDVLYSKEAHVERLQGIYLAAIHGRR
jgi:glycosyltransferase involved in cell wall biosynthesis